MGEVRIIVRVKPGSSRARVGGSYGGDGQLVVSVNARPIDGAANEAVLRALAEALGVHTSQVTLLSGATARSKVVAISAPDQDEAALRARGRALLG